MDRKSEVDGQDLAQTGNEVASASEGAPRQESVFPDERALWTYVLSQRAERFRKLVALRAPESILCGEFVLVMKALAGFAPEIFGSVLSAFYQKAARQSLGRCVFCGKDGGDRPGSWCVACEDEARRESEAEHE